MHNALTAVPRRPKREPSREWLTPQQAAEHLGVHVNTIYRACASRGLRHVQVSVSTIRIRPAWLDEWMESRAS